MTPVHISFDIYVQSLILTPYISTLFRLCRSGKNVFHFQLSPETSLDMTVHLPTRITRSSPPNIKKHEFERIQRSQQRLLLRSKRSSRALPLKSSPVKNPSFLLPKQQSRHDADQQRCSKVLRPRTRGRENASKSQVRSKQRPADSLTRPRKIRTSSDRLQECSICAENKGM